MRKSVQKRKEKKRMPGACRLAAVFRQNLEYSSAVTVSESGSAQNSISSDEASNLILQKWLPCTAVVTAATHKIRLAAVCSSIGFFKSIEMCVSCQLSSLIHLERAKNQAVPKQKFDEVLS